MATKSADSGGENLPASHKLGLVNESDPVAEISRTLELLVKLGERLVNLHGEGQDIEKTQERFLDSDLKERLLELGHPVDVENLNTEKGVKKLVEDATGHLKELMLHQVEHAFKHCSNHHDIWEAVEAFHTDYAKVIPGLDEVRNKAFEHWNNASVEAGGLERWKPLKESQL